MLKFWVFAVLGALTGLAAPVDFSVVRRGMMGPEMSACATKLAELTPKNLLVIGVGGRSTGNKLPLIAKEVGFEIVHIYPEGLSPNITKTFVDSFDYPAITYQSAADWPSVAEKIQTIARQQGLRIAGFIPGMDYGVVPTDFFNSLFQTPGNSPNSWRNNKALLNQHLRELNVPVADSRIFKMAEIEDYSAELKYPVFIKPPAGFASIGASCCRTQENLQTALDKMRIENQRMRHPVEEVMVEDFLHPDTVYFVNTINALIKGKQKRIVTGIAIDSRGDDFPKEVWDLICLLPPPQRLPEREAKLFTGLLEANQLVLNQSETTVGASHLEFMARSKDAQAARDFYPTDLNLRLPGLDFPRLELMATGVDPYLLNLAAHTHPEILENFPELYQAWKHAVGLIFIRSHWTGKSSAEGAAWLNSLLHHPQLQYGGAYLTHVGVTAGSDVVETTNGDSMQGVVAVAGPTMESIRSLHEIIREKERAKFFVE